VQGLSESDQPAIGRHELAGGGQAQLEYWVLGKWGNGILITPC